MELNIKKKLINYRVIIFCIVFLFLQACKNMNNQKKEMNFYNFPKQVYLGELIEGVINYDSDLDTIQLSKKDNRFIFLYMASDTIEYNNINDIKSIKHKAFIGEEGVIKFKFKFERIGFNYLTCIIKDQVILDNYYEDGKARIITNETKLVYEIDVKVEKANKL